MFEEMIEKLAERIDLIDDELMQQKKYVGNLGVVVMKHDGIMEYQNEQLEIKMNANNNFMEENFLSIKAFLQEMNKKTQINRAFEELF